MHRIRAFASLCLVAISAFAGVARAAGEPGWFAFDPPPDAFGASPIDLRGLNERYAGEHGRIAARGDEFVHSGNGRTVRFWGANGLPAGLAPGGALRTTARRLAKYGVNLVRLHGASFDRGGHLDPEKIQRSLNAVAALKAEGIYSHLSLYFPLWMAPAADHAWLEGYDGRKHPFVALMFNPAFQQRYRDWWKALLLTPSRETGARLIDEPAVFGVELQNEDSFFFWTFNEDIPDAQLRMLESRFAAWLKERHGSLEAALARWGGMEEKRDDLAAGRMGFRPLRSVLDVRSARDRDTVRFLHEVQRGFYLETYRFLRELGFKGLITASNWITASPERFGPLEKWSYTAGDFIDRHGYFQILHQGEESSWSIRAGQRYADRSALRFDGAAPGKPRQYANPVIDPTYDGKPSMISETTWNRPNRFRSEAPLYYAAYGALQGTDAIVHFALDGADWWSVNAGGWMQPQTLMTPALAAQFPAAALIYRRGLLAAGRQLAKIELNTQDLLDLKGTPLPQDESFDDADAASGRRIDPLIHYAGRVDISFTEASGRTSVADLKPFIDRAAQRVRSATGQLNLDYGKGVLTLNSPSAQGASGNLGAAGAIALQDVTIQSDLDNGHIVLVPLDGEPIASSRRLLLQVMSEEKPTGFATEEEPGGVKKIASLGGNPWQVKALQGRVAFKGSGKLQFQPLDANGYPAGDAPNGTELNLAPATIYYLVTR
jgi:hypothetical protein